MWSWNGKVRIELLLSCSVPFCTQCSTELDESWNACPNCGNIRPDRPSDQIMLREGSTAEPEPGPGSVSSPSEWDSRGKDLDELHSRIEYLRTCGLNTQQISEDLKLQPSTIEWLSSNTSASDIEKPPDTGTVTTPPPFVIGGASMTSTAPDNQEQKCLNCGSKINTTKTGPMGRAIEWFLGLFFRQTEAEKAESAANKIAPPRCRCGLPIFSDPNNLKETNDLFWIAKESFEPNQWSKIESRGLFHRTVEEYAFRIVNDVQRLDTTVQFKIIGSKIFVQQDGRNVVSEGHDRVARIALNNEHGAQHEYWISVSLTGRTSVETKKPTGFTERRSWILTR